LSRIQSLADYTIDTLESSFQKRQVAAALWWQARLAITNLAES